MERRKRHTEHAEVSRSERLLQYNEKIGQAIVNMVLGSPESEAEDMTLLENGARQAHAETNQSKEPQAHTKAGKSRTGNLVIRSLLLLNLTLIETTP